jgi:MoxR-like ATPase
MDTSPVTESAPAGRITPEEFARRAEAIEREVGRVIVGQRDLVRHTLTTLLANGHALLEGVPGLGKTMLVRTVADVIDCSFNRIQFTPDLMPADITGTELLDEDPQTGRRVFKFVRGPIFASVVLADEINRAPPKTQAALLQAMQEHAVTAAGQTHPLPRPFFVLATQNPIEQEGTYPLPEAQVDRFMLKLRVGYPTRDEEKEVMRRMAGGQAIPVQAVARPEQIMEARRHIADLYMDERIVDYIVDIVHATRTPLESGLKDLAPLIEFGASPRASIALNLAARAHAFLRHRGYVTPEDVKAVGPDVLRHRVVLTYEADAEEVTSEQVVRRVFEVVEVP